MSQRAPVTALLPPAATCLRATGAETLNRWAWKLTLVGIVLAYGIVGSMDYDDAVREQEHTCQMVAAGAWPAQFCTEEMEARHG